MYYVNEGVFGSFNCVISYNLINIPTPMKHSNYDADSTPSELHPAIVWGQTCDSKDKLCETTLPELSIGSISITWVATLWVWHQLSMDLILQLVSTASRRAMGNYCPCKYVAIYSETD